MLILDEPTAALDAPSEYEIFRRFAELTQGRMAILISHRFSTVRMCDRIVVLESGVIRTMRLLGVTCLEELAPRHVTQLRRLAPVSPV